MSMKILYITGTIADHTGSGGYGHIKDFPNAEYIDVAKANKMFWKMGKPFKFLNYIIADWIACKQSKNFDVVHCVYEDNYFFPFVFKCHCKAVGTVHLDINGNYNLIKKLILKKCLKKLDKIIVLSKEQEHIMRQFGFSCNYIPHGYDTPNFTIMNLKEKGISLDENKVNVFFSGTTYRDLDSLEKVILHCQNRIDMVFHILSQKGKNRERFNKLSNVLLYDRLDDDAYFTLLYKCDYVFLPLTFSTANNTLLEAHTLGKVSILPKSGGIMDYASPFDILYESVDEVCNWFDAARKVDVSISAKVMEFSREYSWKSVYKKLETVYSSLF